MKHKIKKRTSAFFKKHKQIGKKIGRPKGSKDLKPRKRRMGNKKGAIKEIKKDIKGIKGISKEPVEKKGYVAQVFPDVKAYKFLGYCKCNAIVSAKDLVSKLIYVCMICGKRARIKTLRNALNITRIDKKEDREEIHRHIDTLPLNDHIIEPKDFKVQE